MNEKCFAKRKNGGCAAVACNCPGYTVCVFYKPVWRWQKDQEAHARMLRRLPEERQLSISEKYYQGRMPWREAPQGLTSESESEGYAERSCVPTKWSTQPARREGAE